MASDIIVRVFFYMIHVILLLIFEQKMHFFQYKILLITVLNATLIFFSVQANPFYTFVLLYIVCYPYFYRIERSLDKEIQEAFENDINLEYYKQ